mgnify:CR=1 FL=1
MLNVCKRLKTEVARRVLNRYKRLVKDNDTDNQRFILIIRVATKGELWK